MSTWSAANQAHLGAELDRVLGSVDRYLGRAGTPGSAAPARGENAREENAREENARGENAWEETNPPALDRLVTAFGLTGFERDTLLLCAGVELDARFATVVQETPGGRRSPTFGLALAALPEPHWSALAPTATLRYWRMIEMGPSDTLVGSPLRIDERILHFLAGLSYPDQRLLALIEPWSAPAGLPASHRAIAERVAALWRGTLTPIQLCGEPDAGLRDVAATACELSGLRLSVVNARDLPVNLADRDLAIRLFDREAILDGNALLVVLDDDDLPGTRRAAASVVERLRGAVLVASREPLRLAQQALPLIDVSKPNSGEQAALWRLDLGPLADRLDGHIDRLVDHFHLDRQAIATASVAVARTDADAPHVADLLWDACRTQARARLDDLAQRIETEATWDDLVLPRPQKDVLRQIVTHVRHRGRVYERWGFAARGARGLGISALFAGGSGTGKTLAAEILAAVLRLDLYRIDLSQVVSKYIGETEKNLRRVFDAAESAGAVLLFDEADALFGKRSEIRDSHDRYANIEVSYLLQRMEAYRGLAILTTNMKQALDAAFLRRIRFVVQFPFPDTAERADIWRRAFPAQTPTDGLDTARLARLNVAGGNIRNIALGAAFLAADSNEPVRMAHLLAAARTEYAKLERSLTGSETAGWL